jgi:serine/threonine protein kinase
MEHDHDSRPRGELPKSSNLDPALSGAAIDEAGPTPVPEGPARRAAEIPTEILEQQSEPIEADAAPSREPPQIGASLKHYEIIRKLGEGGMGTVFLARDTKLGRLVAIKVLRKPTGPSTERFLAEARATARCKHENIVVIHEVDELDGTPYMVLEYLEGRTLRDWMAQRDRPGAPELPAGMGTFGRADITEPRGRAHDPGRPGALLRSPGRFFGRDPLGGLQP